MYVLGEKRENVGKRGEMRGERQAGRKAKRPRPRGAIKIGVRRRSRNRSLGNILIKAGSGAEEEEEEAAGVGEPFRHHHQSLGVQHPKRWQ